MTIPESQLETWSHQGAATKSAETHRSVRAALAAHTWPTGMGHHEYLQGSYPNYRHHGDPTFLRGQYPQPLAPRALYRLENRCRALPDLH